METLTTYPFINRPIADAVLDQTQHEVNVKFGKDVYTVRYYSSAGANLAWNKVKNEVKLQANWNPTQKVWVSVCDLDEFCRDWRLNNCMIFLKK
jgi:hypothetical protein